MEANNGSSSTAADISNGNIQQHFTVPSSSAPAVSIIAQDANKGLYIVDPSQQNTIQMFGNTADHRLMSSSSGNPIELTTTTNNAGQAVGAQTIVVMYLYFGLRLFDLQANCSMELHPKHLI